MVGNRDQFINFFLKKNLNNKTFLRIVIKKRVNTIYNNNKIIIKRVNTHALEKVVAEGFQPWRWLRQTANHKVKSSRGTHRVVFRESRVGSRRGEAPGAVTSRCRLGWTSRLVDVSEGVAWVRWKPRRFRIATRPNLTFRSCLGITVTLPGFFGSTRRLVFGWRTWAGSCSSKDKHEAPRKSKIKIKK